MSSATVGSMVAWPRVAASRASDSVVTGSSSASTTTAVRVAGVSAPASPAKVGAQRIRTAEVISETATTGVSATNWTARISSPRPSRRSRATK